MQHKNYRHYVLSFGHLCADISQGALSAILPFLIAAYHYDYTTAAMLVMASNLVGSVVQPVFGHLADKRDNPTMMIVGILLSGGGMALTGVITQFWGLCIAVIISGIGASMFHPQGAQLVNRNSDESNIGAHMGIFSFGGNLGFTLGPMLASGSIVLFGLKGTLVFLVPSLIFGCLSSIMFPRKKQDTAVEAEESVSETLPQYQDRWGAFAKLGLLIGCRSIVYSGIGTFLVLFFVDILGQTESVGNLFLSLYYAVSAAAALLGGKLADFFGYRRTVWLSFGLLLPGCILFTAFHSFALCILMLIPMGVGLNLGYSSLVLMGQRYLPNHVGFASGITLGLIVSVGGIVAPILGKIGDTYGLVATFFTICAMCAVSFGLSLILSEPTLIPKAESDIESDCTEETN